MIVESVRIFNNLRFVLLCKYGITLSLFRYFLSIAF